MTRPAPMPVESYAPELLDWLVRGAGAELRLHPTTDAERARLAGRVVRLRMLKQAVLRENHPAARLIGGVVVWIDRETGDLMIGNRDRGIDEIEVIGGGASGTAELTETADAPDVLAEFAPSSTA